MLTTVNLSGPVFNGHAQAIAATATEAVRRELADVAEDRAATVFDSLIKVNKHIFTSEFTQTRSSRTYESTATWTRDVDTPGGRSAGRRAVTRTYTMPVEVPPGDIVVTNELATYGPWLEGTGSRNETTRFKGYHGMRMAAQMIDAESPVIADRVIQPYVAEMNLLWHSMLQLSARLSPPLSQRRWRLVLSEA